VCLLSMLADLRAGSSPRAARAGLGRLSTGSILASGDDISGEVETVKPVISKKITTSKRGIEGRLGLRWAALEGPARTSRGILAWLR
jgi:hypothetical protein